MFMKREARSLLQRRDSMRWAEALIGTRWISVVVFLRCAGYPNTPPFLGRFWYEELGQLAKDNRLSSFARKKKAMHETQVRTRKQARACSLVQLKTLPVRFYLRARREKQLINNHLILCKCPFRQKINSVVWASIFRLLRASLPYVTCLPPASPGLRVFFLSTPRF
jgi:hypothetical protein